MPKPTRSDGERLSRRQDLKPPIPFAPRQDRFECPRRWAVRTRVDPVLVLLCPDAAPAGKPGPKFFFFKQKTAYEIGLGIPAEPLFRSQQVSEIMSQMLTQAQTAGQYFTNDQ